jgi:hypothetical protein
MRECGVASISPDSKKCQTERYASRYSDRAVNGCTRALPTVRSVLGHQADSGGQSILSASLITTFGSSRAFSKEKAEMP